jgi:hypothetical protein
MHGNRQPTDRRTAPQTVTKLAPVVERKKPAHISVAGFPALVRFVWLLDLGSNQGPTD